MAGREKEGGSESVCVWLMSEMHKVELASHVRSPLWGSDRMTGKEKLGFPPLLSIYNILGMTGDSFVVAAVCFLFFWRKNWGGGPSC